MSRDSRREVEARLQGVLAANDGAATRLQLLDAGVGRGAIEDLVSVGRLHVRHEGVYVDPPRHGEPRTETAAAELASGGRVSHTSAGALLGFGLDLPAEPHLSIGRTGSARLQGVVVHRPRDLELSRRQRAGGFWVTDAHRTALDLAAVVHDDERYSDLLSAAKGRQRICIPGLWFTLLAHARPGRTGVARLRRYLADPSVTLPTPGVLEARLAKVLTGAGVGPVVVEARMDDEGEFLGRVDALLVDHGIPVEADGWEVHGTPSALDRDLWRQNGLVIADLAPLRYTWRAVYQHPGRVRSQVRKAVERMTPRAS